MIPYAAERRLLQTAVIIGACVPVFAGGAGVVLGSRYFIDTPNVSLDSNLRYLFGILFAIGLCFWSSVPAIETKTARVRLLTLLVVTGGVARLGSLLFVGTPPAIGLFALGMELGVTPALCLWQARIAKLAGAS